MNRKEIVQQLAQYLNVTSKYLGVPSFAYQVGDYTVGRDGDITNKAGEIVTLEQIINTSETTPYIDTAVITLPMDGHDVRSLENLIYMFYSRQELIKKALNFSDDMLDKEFVEELKDTPPTSIEGFINLARGECYGIYFEADTITFTSPNTDPEAIRAFTDLVGLINEKAKELKYTSHKPVQTDNEKYTFRTWLMRLGMIGPEYKVTRKVLLQNLSGNTAFRKISQTKTAISE